MSDPKPSPLAQADDAKRRRDLAAELDILQNADAELRAQPWHPLQPGDVVLLALPPLPGDPDVQQPYGENYVAVDGARDADGSAMLRMASSAVPASFYELWFEAGPSALTVIRAGRIVHGSPAR